MKQKLSMIEQMLVLTCIEATVDKRSLDWSSNTRSCAAALASSDIKARGLSTCNGKMVLEMLRETKHEFTKAKMRLQL